MRRVTFISILVTLATVASVRVGAAQAPATPISGSPVKFETLMFENTLRSAVMQAGQKLAQKAAVLVPDVTLEAADQPIVRGVKLDGGYVFDVQAPNIQSNILVWGMVQQSRPTRGPSSQPVQPVSGRPSATASSVAPDPMTPAPEAFDPNKAYTGYVKDALIAAMLDLSGVLPFGPGERLTVVATGIDEPNANPLYRSLESKLILWIQSSDLQDLRQGKITRDQAKERIVEERF